MRVNTTACACFAYATRPFLPPTDLEYLKRVYKPSGLTFIQDKKDIRKEQSESPDFADALMMGIYALTYHSHLLARKEVENVNPRIVNVKTGKTSFYGLV